MLKNLFFGAMLFLGAIVADAAQPNVVELALTEVGTGPAEEMRDRIFSIPITVLLSDYRRGAIEKLPASIRQQRITSGKLFNRAEKVIRPVLQLHDRAERVELFLYQNDSPRAALWMGCVLILSDSLVALLNEAELMGIAAHELAHSYFMDEIFAAQEADDGRRMKIIELKCDAVALLSLKLLGRDPYRYVSGLRKVVSLMYNDSSGVRHVAQSSYELRTHPSVRERAVFAQRITKLLN